jgi:outer membrane lipoprotein SlyB
MSFTLKSSQTIAVVAVAAALVAGAYAVGRSSQDARPAPVAAVVEDSKPVKLAQAELPKPVTQPSVLASEARLCSECSRVVSVRSEQREGEGSGLGAVGGAVLGGILGNQVGGGTGKKIATVGGAVAGGYAGNEIEKRQKSRRVWIVRLEHKDGSSRTLERASDPGLKAGDIVELRDGELHRH